MYQVIVKLSFISFFLFLFPFSPIIIIIIFITELNKYDYEDCQHYLIPYSHYKPKRTEAKRSEAKRSEANRTAESAPFTLAQNAQQCAFSNSILSTLHTVECASFHTGSEAKCTIEWVRPESGWEFDTTGPALTWSARPGDRPRLTCTNNVCS